MQMTPALIMQMTPVPDASDPTIAVRRPKAQHPSGKRLSAIVRAFRQPPKRRERSLFALVILRRLENRTGFAGIRIKAEDQELGSQRPQIDRAAHKRLRSVPF